MFLRLLLLLSCRFKDLKAGTFPVGSATNGGGVTTVGPPQKTAFICKCGEAPSPAGYANEKSQTVQMDETEQG